MKIRTIQCNEGLGLVDAVFAMAIAGVLFGGLYAGLAFGFDTIKFARENTRATQIMVEKMETVRLKTWNQLTNFSLTNFVVPYYTSGGTNSSVVYTGNLSIANCELPTTYAGSMKRVTIRLNWITGRTARTRQMTTYVAERGMQQYVY
jgi:hypothetical protein